MGQKYYGKAQKLPTVLPLDLLENPRPPKAKTIFVPFGNLTQK